ncbi:MAG: COX15/CtaA family protein [Microthrixaceae bacterium]
MPVRLPSVTPTRFLAIGRLAVFALGLIIVTGATVRLTGSGLGCTNWPLCTDGRPLPAMSLHPMVEFVNRLITGFVSLAVIVAVLGARRRIPFRRDLVRWSWGLVSGVVAQIVIGAFVTLSDLKYSVVALHFLVSMVLVWAAVHLTQLAAQDVEPRHGGTKGLRSGVGVRPDWRARVLPLLGAAVLVSGSVVTSVGKHPGARVDGNGVEHVVKRLPFDLGQTTRVHSVLVWLLCFTALSVAWSHRGTAGRIAASSRLLLIVIVTQGALGYTQYHTGVPPLLVVFHVAFATVVWVMTLRVAHDLTLDDATCPSGVTAGRAGDTSVSEGAPVAGRGRVAS